MKKGELYYTRTPKRSYTNIFKVLRINKNSVRVQHLFDDLTPARFSGTPSSKHDRESMPMRLKDTYCVTYSLAEWNRIVPRYWAARKGKAWADYVPALPAHQAV